MAGPTRAASTMRGMPSLPPAPGHRPGGPASETTVLHRYTGRFAPSPTGPLHAGSLVAALASWLDARAHGGRWLVRIEDVDTPRCVPGADAAILRQLQALGLPPDEPPAWQRQRGAAYQAALDALVQARAAYPCLCTRADIARANAQRGLPHQRHAELVYPGTCRQRDPADTLAAAAAAGRTPAWRLRVPTGAAACIAWTDRRLGSQQQELDTEVGDFVLRRSDGLWAYQLAVVVDDAAQGITHVVRGEDLADNTPRQIWLQHCLGVPTPQYLHTPLVRDARGEKLSKQHGAPELDVADPLRALRDAGTVLGLHAEAATAAGWLAQATASWQRQWAIAI
jgi:glutamyl-Q tRNA(Asp) synthetase